MEEQGTGTRFVRPMVLTSSMMVDSDEENLVNSERHTYERPTASENTSIGDNEVFLRDLFNVLKENFESRGFVVEDEYLPELIAIARRQLENQTITSNMISEEILD